MPSGRESTVPSTSELGQVSGEIKARKTRREGKVETGPSIVINEEFQQQNERSAKYKQQEGERRAASAYDIAWRAHRGEALSQKDANEIKRLGKEVMLAAQAKVNAEVAQIDQQMKNIRDAAQAEQEMENVAMTGQADAAFDQAMRSERAQMVDKGVAVEKRLEAIRGELKNFGYDVDSNVAKPPFWGGLTKKGRLIKEFNSLAADENYQYLLQAREDNKKRSGADAKKYEARMQKRAMDYRAGGLTRTAEPVIKETREEREGKNAGENDYERRAEKGGLTPAERLKEGEKINKMIKNIDDELNGFSLSVADLAVPMDRKTSKMLKNAGVDTAKLRTEYFSLLNNPDYQNWLSQKEK